MTERAGGGIALRPALPGDREFLLSVYAATRTEELAPVPWTDEQKALFIRQQFEAQDHEYRRAYPEGLFQIIEREDVPSGRLYLNPGRSDTRIVDLALLPFARGLGIGSRLLDGLARDADRFGRSLSIHVEVMNTGARRLYSRFGFRLREDKGVYLLLERPTLA
ncbi:MAG: GNAT family N-acetyltransferase [Thermoanaerobaculia bacterium]